MTELRRRLRKAGVEYVVIKNTLALRAVNESGLVGERLQGPDRPRRRRRIAVAAAKVLTDFAKENEQTPAVKGGLLDGEVDRRGAGEAARVDAVARADAGRARCRPAVPDGAFVGALNGLLMHVCRRARSAEDAARRRLNSQAYA